MQVFFYVSSSGEDLIEGWRSGLDGRSKAKFDAKLDMVSRASLENLPGISSGTGVGGIRKLQIGGERALRPMFCEGPFGDDEITILAGAEERDRLLIPADAARVAKARRADLINGTAKRRHYEPSP